jgi:GntR family transcriptional regulator
VTTDPVLTAPADSPLGARQVLVEAAGLAPKYSRLKVKLLAMIGGLEPGSAIPTERELCTLYGVSRTTVRQALQELVHEGQLYRRQGRGTFVAPPKLVQTMQLKGHTEEMEAQGLRPGSRPLSAGDVAASPELAAFFGLAEGAPVHRIVRVRLVDDEPIALQTVYLDAARFGDVGESLTGWVSLYRLLRDRYDTQIAGGEETVEAGAADTATAELLNVEAGAPLLVLHRRSWEADGRPIEWSESLYRGDRYRMAVRLAPG